MRLFSSQSDTVEHPSTLSGVRSIFGPIFLNSEIDGLYYDLPGFFLIQMTPHPSLLLTDLCKKKNTDTTAVFGTSHGLS